MKMKTIFNKLTKQEQKWLCPDGWSEIAEDSIVYKEVNKEGFIEAYNTGLIKDTVYFDIAVLKEYRGKGVASQMMQNMVDYMKKNNFSMIYTLVHKDNDPSFWMLDKFGFELFDCSDDFWKLKLKVA